MAGCSKPHSIEGMTEIMAAGSLKAEAREKAKAAAVRVGGRVKAPAKTKHAEPVCPAMAQSARVGGVVIIEATS